MSKQVNTLSCGVHRFLTTRFEIDVRDATEKAIAHYIRERNLTPKQFAKGEFKIGWLHHYLCLYDKRWTEIPPNEMKTTPPRTLVHNINSYINRWKKDYEAVQKVIDKLPEVKDNSEDPELADNRSITRSENSDGDQEENKDQ